MENNQEVNVNLEKMIRKSTKIAKDKYIALQQRNNRKLNIKVKKSKPKGTETDNSNTL
jgi:ElaB/YqjD/DUF883 family membrane-anchored ribosome-binding protein